MLHLHRLDDDHRIARLDRSAVRDRHEHDGSGHRRVQVRRRVALVAGTGLDARVPHGEHSTVVGDVNSVFAHEHREPPGLPAHGDVGDEPVDGDHRTGDGLAGIHPDLARTDGDRTHGSAVDREAVPAGRAAAQPPPRRPPPHGAGRAFLVAAGQQQSCLREDAVRGIGEPQPLQLTRDQPGVEVAGDDRRQLEQQPQEFDVRGEAEDRRLVERGDQAPPGLVAVGARRDDLREHRVVVDRHVEAVLERGVDADAIAGRVVHGIHPPAGRKEACTRVFGVHARFDAVTAQHDVVLHEGERLARRDAQLLLDEVDAGDLFGDGVLDLQPRVHLHEEELVGPVGGHDELDGAGAAVGDAARGLARRLPDARPRLLVQERRGRLLDDLLVPTLQRALTLAQMDHVPVRIGEDLHLDVPRVLHVPLEEQSVVAEARRRLATGGG